MLGGAVAKIDRDEHTHTHTHTHTHMWCSAPRTHISRNSALLQEGGAYCRGQQPGIDTRIKGSEKPVGISCPTPTTAGQHQVFCPEVRAKTASSSFIYYTTFLYFVEMRTKLKRVLTNKCDTFQIISCTPTSSRIPRIVCKGGGAVDI